MGEVGIDEMACCGLRELVGSNRASVKALKEALRFAGQEWAGICIATTTSPNRAKTMRAAGFRQHRKFKNPNTGNVVTVWMADTGATYAQHLKANRRDSGRPSWASWSFPHP